MSLEFMLTCVAIGRLFAATKFLFTANVTIYLS